MRTLTLLVALAFAGAGCDGSGSGAAKKYRLAILPKMLNNEVFNYGKLGAEATAREIEKKEGVRIEALWDAPPTSNPAQLASILQSYADQKVDGISVSVDEASTLKKAIDYAADKGVPVMTFDSDAPESKRRAFFGTDDKECGERLARFLAKQVKKGKVAIQSGTT